MSAVGFKLSLDSRMELVGVVDIEGAVTALQFKALADGK